MMQLDGATGPLHHHASNALKYHRPIWYKVAAAGREKNPCLLGAPLLDLDQT
jgi:hypothetical protein